MIRFVAIAGAMLLTGCAGSTLSSNRGATDTGCGAINVNAGGSGAVCVMPQGAIGWFDSLPNEVRGAITGWQYPGQTAVPAVVTGPAPVAPVQPAVR